MGVALPLATDPQQRPRHAHQPAGVGKIPQLFPGWQPPRRGLVERRRGLVGCAGPALVSENRVVELAALYGGSLTLGTAPIGGLRAELVLPAV